MLVDLKSQPALIQAVFAGDVNEVRSLIDQKVDINYQNPSTRLSALHVAAFCSGNSSSSKNNKLSLNLDAKGGVSENGSGGDEDSSSSTTALYNKYSNYIEIVDLLCKSGARVNSKDIKSLTPLHYACRSNGHETVRILLDNQADVNSRDKNWQAPIHICAMYNSIKCASYILEQMMNIDVSDRQGRSALAHAAFNGNTEMVELLLENGANGNINDKQERRPIHWASYIGYTEIVRLLVKYGADVNCLDKDLYTPLLVACASGKSEETISLLIDLGADVTASNIHDSSVYHLACLNGNDQILKELLYTHNITMKVNSKGYHPIHYAAGCKRGQFCLEFLISLNIDVNLASSADGRTPLHVAALQGRTSCAQILYSNGAQIDVKDSEDNTPLHLAALNGQSSMISFLVECGANIYKRGANGLLCFAMAALNGHFYCFKIIDQIIPTISSRKQYFETKDDYGRSFMHLAAISGNFECLNMLINSDCDLNQTDKWGNTPLHYCCAGSFLKCVELLVNAGCEINEINNSLLDTASELLDETNTTNSPNSCGFGCTPLMLACAFDQDGYVVRELVFNARAKADIIDKNGYNTLHYAALQGNRNVFEILLEQCKFLNQQCNELMISPLHILAYHGYKDSLEFLLANKFRVDCRDKNGRTPLDLACFKGESSCVECLLKYGASYKTHDNINERTPLHAAAYNNNEECLKAIANFLDIENQSDFKSDLLDKHGRTPLMVAVEQGHLNTISLLITHMNADVLACDLNKRTALHRSAALGYEECCLLILKSNLNSAFQKDINGLLPIHYAVMAGHANLISMFFEYFEQCLNPSKSSDANTEQVLSEKLLDNEGFSLLHYACVNGHSTCAEIICELGQTYKFLTEMLTSKSPSQQYNKFSVLHAACQNSHDACVSFLLEKFSDHVQYLIELEDSNGNRPLHICAINNEYDCALLLIESNCSLNEKNKFGNTPFMLAARSNSFSIMELLLSDKASSKKIDLNCIDRKGNSCLHLALLNKHENCALFILDKIEPNSYLINLQNKEGDTLLHMAATHGFLTCVEILLSKGADILLKNNRKKRTPLLMCAKNDQVADCLELMLSRLIFMISNGTMNAVDATASNKTTSNLMMMMMTPANNNQMQGVNLNGKNNNNENLEGSFTCLNNVNSLNMVSQNVSKKSPNRLDANNEFKINDCIRMHNEASNLNSTLILTENEILVDDENDVLEENDVIITNHIPNGNHLEMNKEVQVSESLDLNLVVKIAPISTIQQETDFDKIKSLKEKVVIDSLKTSNDTVKSSDYSSDIEFY